METANQTTVSAQRQMQAMPQHSLMQADQSVDMFSERGFVLANRIAKAFASSTAVPSQFQMFVLKKVQGVEQWQENPAAIGNCLVAIEVARAVGMSIVAVMQNADMIEGKLRWSGKFVIAAINASKRFTPLRFDMKELGRLEASYKEKTGWDEKARKPIMTEKKVTIDNRQCIAWALPYGMAFPPGVHTLTQAKAAGLPVIESAPVTMKLAVEEGWYAKSGSKWQTGLSELMFQYRSGSFFGNVHAPDIVMGMGRTSEEAVDMMTTTVDVSPDGHVTSVTTEELRRPAGDTPAAEVVNQVNTTGNDEQHQDAGQQGEGGQVQPLPFSEVADAIVKAKTPIEMDAARALIPSVEDAMQQAELNAKVTARLAEINKPATKSRRSAAASTTAPE